jgi:LuxR family maltose regulon positive regulatory protein
MRLMLLGWTDQVEKVAETVDRAVRAPRTSDAFTAGLTLNAVAFIDATQGRHVKAQEALAQCRALCEPIHAIYVLSYAASFQAAIELVCGNVMECRQLLTRAMDRVVDAGQRYSSAGAVVATYLAEALYEQNELEACRALLADFLPIIADTGMPDHLIIAHRTCARIHFKSNERDEAFARLAALDELGATRGIPRLRAAAWLEKGHLFLLDGDTENAGRVIRVGLGDPAWAALSRFELHAHDIEPPEIGRIRLLLARGESSIAQRAIESALDKAHTALRMRRCLRLRFLQGVAMDAQGRHAQADESLLAVLKETRARQLIRVIADEPSATAALWDRLARATPQADRAWIRDMALASARREGPSPGAASSSGPAASPLSSRETQILRLVAAGQSNKQVARSLFLTENTVESHLRRINAKLGTRTRTQALAKAREIGTI